MSLYPADWLVHHCHQSGITCGIKSSHTAECQCYSDWRWIISVAHQVSREEMDPLVMDRAALSPTPSMGTLMPPLPHSLGVRTLLRCSLGVKLTGEMMMTWRWMETTPLALSPASTWTDSPAMATSALEGSSAGSRTQPSSTNWGSPWRRSSTAAPRGWKSLAKGWIQTAGPCALRIRFSPSRSNGAGRREPRSHSRERETSHPIPFLLTLFLSSRTNHTLTLGGKAPTLCILFAWAYDRWGIWYILSVAVLIESEKWISHTQGRIRTSSHLDKSAALKLWKAWSPSMNNSLPQQVRAHWMSVVPNYTHTHTLSMCTYVIWIINVEK